MRVLTAELLIPDDVRIEPSKTRLWHLGREMAAAASSEYGDLVGVLSIKVEEVDPQSRSTS